MFIPGRRKISEEGERKVKPPLWKKMPTGREVVLVAPPSPVTSPATKRYFQR